MTPAGLPRYNHAMPRSVRHEDEEAQAKRLTSSLFGLAMVLAMVVLCLIVLRHVAANARVEDCLMAGRSNCDRMLERR